MFKQSKRIAILFGMFIYVGSIQAGPNLPDFTDLVEASSPSVVNISTTRTVDTSSLQRRLPEGLEIPEGSEGPFEDFIRRFFGGEGQQPFNRERNSLGSGFIISEDGYVITNNHVVQGADEIIVRLSDRRELEAEIIGTDATSDIAVLKIDADGLPVAKTANVGNLKVGEWVLAIGSPFGFEHSVTAGIVSAKGRSLPNENYVPFIQTDVAINPGNSGGPLFNLDGEVVGVNSQIYSRTGGFMGLSFAIPIDVALEVVEQLKTKGSVSRGWLGVLIQEVTRDLAETFGMSKPYGALVSQVLEDSPAKKGGIEVGDVIIEFNGSEVTSSATLPPMVGRVSAGSDAKITLLRNGREKKIVIEVGELPVNERASQPNNPSSDSKLDRDYLGMQLGEIDADMKGRYNLDGGVLVKAVKDNPALNAGLQVGDIIARINNQRIENLKDFLDKIDGQKPGSSVALLVQRRQGPIFLALKIPKN